MNDGASAERVPVLLCDDAVAYGLLFRQWVEDAGMELIGPAATAADAVALAAEHRPTVIVVDHLLGGTTSDVLVPELRGVAPEARILLISGMTDDGLAEAASRAAADGHMTKASGRAQMAAAIRALAGPSS